MSQLVLSTVSQSLVLTPESGPALTLTLAAAPQLVMSTSGMQGAPGPPGPPATPGPGFVLVGAELRFSISSLPQG